ncbi:MAG TPA: hypothetical protein VMF08_22220 [Candidatus Sulfotelmatobacter sp.]|nr:hypothetical protein [Candidatus Sulfotelmatobacter sp.]
MKFETLNGILTFILGVLVILGVVFVMKLWFVTHDTRALVATANNSKINLARAEAVFGEAQAYDKKYPSPELERILQMVQKPKSTSR